MRSRRRGWLASLLAFLFFVGLAALPLAYHGRITPPWVEAARRTSPIPLPAASALPPRLRLSAVATPIRPDEPPAALPVLDATHMAALVAGEDLRLRTLLHHANRMLVPELIPVRGALPTLVLPGPGSYSLADLENAGAVAPLTQERGFVLVNSVLVAPGATLKLGAPEVSTLHMDSSVAGFTSLVTWGGTLVLSGDNPNALLVITGWDRTVDRPAADNGYGRPYIRAVGGKLDLKFVHASSLGFWSGRTGGVAWTGISSRAASGSAVSSQFTGNTYGAFVSRATKIQFTADLFEGNQLDGLRLHRNAIDSVVTGSAAARNGGNGFVVGRGATGDMLSSDLAVHNQGNGFLLNGQPLVSGASPSGGQSIASVGTVVQYSEASDNGRTGILVEGGSGTVVRSNVICGPITGIAVRAGASGTFVVGNQVRCGGRIALSIGPGVTGTTISDNTLSHARIGILIRNAPGVRIMNNQITDVSIFGISVRGLAPGVVGNDNLIAGRGYASVDTRGGADAPSLVTTDVSAWQHGSQLTAIGFLRYHPLLTSWLVLLVLVAITVLVVRLRRRNPRPYRYSFGSQPPGATANGANPLDAEQAILVDIALTVPTETAAASQSRAGRRRSAAPIRHSPEA